MDLLFEQGSVALGFGNGTFALSTIPTCQSGGYTGPCDAGAVIADFNLDGRNDVMVAPYDRASGKFSAVFRMGTQVEPELNAQSLRIPVGSSDGLIAADWNGDTAIDLAVASETTIRVYMNMIETRVISSGWGVGRQVSPGSLASVYGVNYTTGTTTTPSYKNPQPTLGGVQLRLTDEAGRQSAAPLLFVSPQQINFLVPESTSLGWSKVELVKDGTTRTVGWMETAAVTPSLFPIVTEERSNPDGTTSSIPLSSAERWPTPMVVAFYGTGFRGATPENTVVDLGYSHLKPLRISPHPDLTGVQVIVLEVKPSDVDYEDGIYGGYVLMNTQGVVSPYFYTGFY